MSQYNPPTQIVDIFNISDYSGQDSNLSLSAADKRYAKLFGFNNFLGTNNFKNIVSIYDSPLNIFDGGINTAGITSAGVINCTDLTIENISLSSIYAPLDSPHFINIPTAPTPLTSTSSNQIATCDYVRANLADLVNGSPDLLNTLNEISNAIANDPQFSATVFGLINLKHNIIDSNNKLNSIFIGNGDVNNTKLSYLKNVTTDIESSINNLNKITTGITYDLSTTTISNRLLLNRKELVLSDVSNTTNYYSTNYYDGTTNYITNSAGHNNINARTIFRFISTTPNIYVDTVTISTSGILTTHLTSTGIFNANGGLIVPVTKTITLLGNLYVNNLNITPAQLSMLDGLTQNVQNTLILQTSSLNINNVKLSGISYDNVLSTTNINNNTAMLNATINNNISVGGSVIIGKDIIISGNIVCSGTIIQNDNNKKYKAGYLNISNMSLPIIKSIANTKKAFTNLNLRLLFGLTGNNSSITIYQNYKIILVSGNEIIFTVDNTNGTDILYSNIIFNISVFCTGINVFYKNYQI